MRQSTRIFWKNFSLFLPDKVDSVPEVDSRPRSFSFSAQCLVRQWRSVRCDVVWWWRFFSRCCLRFCVGQRYSDEGKYTSIYFQYPDVVGCVVMSCGGESFFPDGAYDYTWDSVKPMKGNTPSLTSCTLVGVGCVWHAERWFSCIGVFCADNHNYFQFMLKGKRCSGRCPCCAASQVLFVC